MSQLKISGRQLRHGAPEEKLSPGESITIKKRSGKVFELKRVDVQGKSMDEGLEQLFREMPNTGPACKVNLSAIIIEDRE
jgi:hypothetical protein